LIANKRIIIQGFFFTDSADYTALWNELREQVSLVKSLDPVPGQGAFGHITGGYDAGYYGYVLRAFSAVLVNQTVMGVIFQLHLFASICSGYVCDSFQE